MCAIVDANAATEVFGSGESEAGDKFLDWLFGRRGRLVVGGRLLDEYHRAGVGTRAMYQQLQVAGRIQEKARQDIDQRAQEIVGGGTCRSDDAHVLALAQVSGARLLYTNDYKLQQDFNDPALINRPRGKVYTTRHSSKFTKARRDTLQKAVCPSVRYAHNI